MNSTNSKWVQTLVACVAATAIGSTVQAAVTQTIEPATIGLGEPAQLTIAASGPDAASISPPMVAGLEFVAVGQSQRIESINGNTRSTTSIMYQVIPQHPGVFTIPGANVGSPPLVLTVNDGNGAANAPGTRSAAALPQGFAGTQAGAATQMGANGGAFVRLRLAKHDLYVGETIPVDIQVGTRDGVVASLNGQPALNGDAFTLNKLSDPPQRTAEVIDGRPFTVFTWHSLLAAVKPGHLSLTMETPLTVRIHGAVRPDSGLFGAAGLDDLFNDPAMQNFFGTSTEKDVTVASSPASFAVQALPAAGRPANFSGAVGKFSVSSDLSDAKVAVGDPVTLRLHVSGAGNFDRVGSPMLHDVDHWKTYAPTATFSAADSIGYRGDKTFDQPLIATEPGAALLPAIAFSWFDPSTGHYVDAHTAPLNIAVAAGNGSADSPAQGASPQASPPAAVVANGSDATGLRPDEVVTRSADSSLSPHYFEAPYVVAPSVLALAFLSAGFWIRRRERRADETSAARDRETALQTAPLLTLMDQAARTSNAALFFTSARQAVQRVLARRWQVPPSSVTAAEARQRLGPQTKVVELFELADEAAYAKVKASAIDFKLWKRVVVQQIDTEMAS